MNTRRGVTTVWLLLGFIFVEMFISHVFPLFRESHPDSSRVSIGVRAGGSAGEQPRMVRLALPIQEDGGAPADHCCMCSCTHMLISQPANPAFFNEVSPSYAARSVVFPPDPSPGGLTPPPKFS
jgi:hypothetical protein